MAKSAGCTATANVLKLNIFAQSLYFFEPQFPICDSGRVGVQPNRMAAESTR